MSTVKHRPATPLPFRSDEDAILGADGSDAGAPDVSDQNLAYVIHTANAYPKLVEALKLVSDILGARTPLPGESSERPVYEPIDALLRELGEAS